MRYPDGKEKAVTFSYDDGVPADISLSDVFAKYNMKATFNLSSAYIKEKPLYGHLSANDVKTYILGRGFEVAVHGKHHLAPGHIRPIDGIKEFLDCRLDFEKMFGRIIQGAAYPNSGIRLINNGLSYDIIKNYLKDIDIKYARTLGGDNNSFCLPTDWHAWMPTAHHNNEKIFDYIEEFTNYDYSTLYYDSRYPRLMYIWGHSFEFDNNNNWDRIEEICYRLGHRNDTWYATNIEIYDYVTAYNSLIFSADSSMVYNPTLKTLWFDIYNSQTYKIEPGETLILNN